MAKNIWDGFGKRVGSISNLPSGHVVAYDHNSQPLGSSNRNGTFTTNSKLVSRTPMPGLLFNRTGKQKK